MAVTAAPYGAFLTGLGAAQFNFTTDTVRIMLVTSAYTPNMDTHTFQSDVTGEVGSSGTGYTSPGLALSNASWAYDPANDRTVLSADPLTWTGVSFTVRYAVAYKVVGTAATNRLIGWIDFGEDKNYLNEDFQLLFSNGVVRIRAA